MLNKKFLSLVLAILMVVSMIPFAAVTAFAASETLPSSGNYAFTSDSWSLGGNLVTSDGTSITMRDGDYKTPNAGVGYKFINTTDAKRIATTANTFDLSGGFVLSFDLAMLLNVSAAYYGSRFTMQIGNAFTLNIQGPVANSFGVVHYSIGAGAFSSTDKTYGTNFATTRYGDYNTGINRYNTTPTDEDFAVTNTTFTIIYKDGAVSVYSGFLKSDTNASGIITWGAGSGDAAGASSFAIDSSKFKDVSITMTTDNNFVTMNTTFVSNIALRAAGECAHATMAETITVEPTCTETGIITKSCTDCNNYTETAIADALGHVQGEKVSTTATCTESGYATYTCSRCGENFQVAEKAFGHTDLGARVTIDGYTYKVCDVCGAQYDRQIKVNAGASYEFSAASWKLTGEIAGTVSEDGTSATVGCYGEGGKYPPKEFTLEDGSTAPTYYNPWQKLTSVDRYDLTDGFTFSFDAKLVGRLGACWGQDVVFTVGNISLTIDLSAGQYAFELKNGSTSLGKFTYKYSGVNGTNNSSAAQCRTDADCAYINTTYTFEYKNGNFTLYMASLKSAENPTGAVTFTNGKSSFAIDSTAFDLAYIDLSKPYGWVENTEVFSNISLYGAGEACTHEEETTVVRTTEPTCTETGVDTTRCAKCGKTLGTTTVAALGHSWGEWETTKAPTCKTPGTDTRTCATCNETETRAIETTDHVAGTTYAKHTDGNYYLTCKDCGEVILTEKLEAPKFEGVQEGTANGLLSVRFVGTIDTTVYTKIGFEISAPDYEKNWTTSSKTVYSKIVGSIDTGVVEEYTAESLGAAYIYAATVTGVPVTGTVVFNVTSYAEFNGDKITGDTYTVTYTNGEFVSIDPVA